jgi:stress-induced-phosphoprotein 1
LQLEEAIKYMDKSLTENRTPDVAKLKQQTEKDLKEKQKLSYINPQLSAEARERGNELFKNHKYPEAIKEYTEAVNRNPSDSKCYSNRAAAYHKLLEFSLALADCNKAIELEPGFVKGLTLSFSSRSAHCS